MTAAPGQLGDGSGTVGVIEAALDDVEEGKPKRDTSSWPETLAKLYERIYDEETAKPGGVK